MFKYLFADYLLLGTLQRSRDSYASLGVTDQVWDSPLREQNLLPWKVSKGWTKILEVTVSITDCCHSAILSEQGICIMLCGKTCPFISSV